MRIAKFTGIVPALAAALLLGACGKSTAPDAAQQAQAMAQMHEHDLPAPSPQVQEAVSPPASVESQSVTYGTLSGVPLQGWFAKPKGADGALPGVLMFHEWWGLNDNIRRMAELLAAQGYLVLAADMYGGKSADAPDAAQKLMQTALADGPKIDRNIEAAYAWLKDTGKAQKIGTLGWCFGGSMSFEAAQVLSGRTDATVIYYGFVNDKPAAMDKLKAPVLALFGGKDGGIPATTVEGFARGLETRHIPAIVKTYPDAGHAFANPSGQNYREDDAEDAWKRTLDFLGETLALAPGKS